ncbi:ABC transporter permease [Bacteroides sp. UBA939]|uniref:ABC transporter permease n=1 Tax=Bacteroides sp. UBA939 TaxID=1946092 RepID=UPI0025C5E87B|nr:FtsX-like permease family protein [Bacteroides sp. UBA939]
MIKSILTQIWNQRRANGWLFAELLIVFVLLWYCLDILYGFAYAENQSKGYNLEHVYKIRLSSNPNQFIPCSSEDSLKRFWFNPIEEAVRRIKQYPGVESAGVWFGSDAYTRSVMFQGYTIDSVYVMSANIRYVSPEYFKVMRIPIQEGTGMFSGDMNAFESTSGSSLSFASAEWNPAATPLPAVITSDMADSLFHADSRVVGREFFDYYAGSSLRYRVAAVCSHQKRDDYARYEPFILTPLPSWFYRTQRVVPSISIRVRPEADTDDFATRFYRDMTSRLQLAPFYLFEIRSYDEQKAERDAAEGITPYIRSARFIAVFFSFNVFIGLMGTFWFRTRHRRSEIALRMAMGSSRMKICGQLLGEGLLLLVLATIPALIICGNLVLGEATMTEQADATGLRFTLVSLSTFLLMGLMVITGVWFPATRAMRVQPAEALHDE